MSWPYYRQGPRSFCAQYPGMAHWGEYIGRVNFIDQPSPFAAFPNSQLLFPHVPCSVCGELHPEIRPFVGNQSDMHLPSYKRSDYVGWKRANDLVGKIPTTTSIASYGYGYGYATEPMPNGAVRRRSISGSSRRRAPRPGCRCRESPKVRILETLRRSLPRGCIRLASIW